MMAVGGPPALSVWTDVRPDPGERDGCRRYAELPEEARLADSLPFRAFCTTEQHGVDDGYLPAQLPLIAGLATATERIRFITSALLLLFRPWREVVEEATVVDLLSRGRLELGVAAGGFAREFELFGIDMSKRAELMEQALPFIRMGLTEGQLPDGPGGSMLPALPRPAQARVPVYLGGLSPAAIDRAVRLTDGVIPYDFLRPEEKFPGFWKSTLKPALERHGRSLTDFRFILCTSLWASDDPERDWEVFYRAAVEYQFSKYAEWAGGWDEPGYATLESLRHRQNLLVDTPENVAKRLLELRVRAPYHELMFWYRIRGIPHDRALEHLELVANRVVPLLAEGNVERPAAGQPSGEGD